MYVADAETQIDLKNLTESLQKKKHVKPRYTIKAGKEKTIQLLILGKLIIQIGKIGPYPQTTHKE